MAMTSSHVDIYQSNNGTLQAAFQFDPNGGTTWNLSGKSFQMDVKASPEDTVALLSLTSGANEIIVDDAVQRIVHLNVDPAALRDALPNGQYRYDFVMIDPSETPDIVTPLMHGTLYLKQGITET